jgi:MFS family permease
LSEGLAEDSAEFRRVVLSLVICQFGLHACMHGMRVALPLQALDIGYSVLTVGILVALFALVPALFAIAFGRWTDRAGYHFPVRIAAALSMMAGFTLASSDSLAALCVGAAGSGAGSGFGMIAAQRYASQMSSTPGGRVKLFSWITLAPALAGLVSSVVAGGLIDTLGFRAAFAALGVFPVLTMLVSSAVPRRRIPTAGTQRETGRGRARDLLKIKEMRRLLLINWVVAVSWDAHSFVIPILGHEQGFSASEIGAIFASFSLAGILVRLLIPFVSSKMSVRTLLLAPLMLATATFLVYPLLQLAWAMCICAFTFGLALGCVHPTILAALHDVTPPGRHGEALAVRSMMSQLSMTVMPLAFGVIGVAIGSSVLLWTMAVALGMGALQSRNFCAITDGRQNPGSGPPSA